MFANFTEETCTGTTGNLALAGATTGKIPFSESFSDGDAVAYTVEDSGGVIKASGVGTYTASGNVITRTASDTWSYDTADTPDVTKNRTTNKTLSAGTHTVRCDAVADNFPNGYAAVFSSATQTIAPSTFVKVTNIGGNVESDINGWWDGANFRFTPAKLGSFLITGLATFGSQVDGTYQIVMLYKNGSLYKLLGRGTHGASSSSLAGFGGATIAESTALTDYYEMYVYGNDSAFTLVPNPGYSTFNIVYLGVK